MADNAPNRLDQLLDFAKGIGKGNTVDTLGAPVDIVNAITAPVQKALGIYNENAFLGSNHLRDVFGLKQSENDSLMETGGGLLSVGGAAKAMIVGAARLGKVDKTIDVEKAIEFASKHPEVNKGSVYNMTGVYQDTDGKFKAVISDKDARLKLDESLVDKEGFQYNPDKLVKLDQILDHPKLFELYPELKDLDVFQKIGSSREGGYHSGKKYIQTAGSTGSSAKYIRAHDEAKAAHREQMGLPPKLHKQHQAILETTLHEVQHAIQDIERFIPGGAPRYPIDPGKVQVTIREAEKSSDQSVKDAAQRFKARANELNAAAYEKYMNIPGEQEARFTEMMREKSTEEIAGFVHQLLKESRSPQKYRDTDAEL